MLVDNPKKINFTESIKKETDSHFFLTDCAPRKKDSVFLNLTLGLAVFWLVFGTFINVDAKNLPKIFELPSEQLPRSISFAKISNSFANSKEIFLKPSIDNISISEDNDFYAPQKIRISAKGTINIGVFGDSMADGAWSGLYREIGGGEYGLYKFSAHSTGLTNYDFFDTAEEAKKSIKEKPIQIAIIMTGTNDQRGINGRGINVGYASTRWEKNYKARIDELIEILKDENIAVYWVGLPKMREKQADSAARNFDLMFKKQAIDNEISFVSTLQASSNANGEFSMRLHLPDENSPRILRAKDGVHFEMVGYRLLSYPIIKMINKDLEKIGKKIEPKSLQKKKIEDKNEAK